MNYELMGNRGNSTVAWQWHRSMLATRTTMTLPVLVSCDDCIYLCMQICKYANMYQPESIWLLKSTVGRVVASCVFATGISIILPRNSPRIYCFFFLSIIQLIYFIVENG